MLEDLQQVEEAVDRDAARDSESLREEFGNQGRRPVGRDR